mgnify:CR=1 FL=1
MPIDFKTAAAVTSKTRVSTSMVSEGKDDESKQNQLTSVGMAELKS